MTEKVCIACEGVCIADKLESCEICGIKYRIGCAENPSDHSIFNDRCDNCREYETIEMYELGLPEYENYWVSKSDGEMYIINLNPIDIQNADGDVEELLIKKLGDKWCSDCLWGTLEKFIKL